MPKENPLLAYGRYGSLGFEFSGMVLAGILFGHYTDRYLGTEPWLLILGAIAGLAGAIARLLAVLQQSTRERQNDRED
jgi:F0F1-type ATP synthase assembly protein I